MKTKQQLALVGLFVCILVFLDQITKIWAVAALSSQPRAILGNFLSFELVYNSGAAFSLGANTTWIFTLIALVACTALPILIWRSRRFSSQLVLGAIWAGALGNLIDRLFREPGYGQGHVVDFINYSDFFVGNVADIELVAGAIALILMEFFLARSESERAPESMRSDGFCGCTGVEVKDREAKSFEVVSAQEIGAELRSHCGSDTDTRSESCPNE